MVGRKQYDSVVLLTWLVHPVQVVHHIQNRRLVAILEVSNVAYKALFVH